MGPSLGPDVEMEDSSSSEALSEEGRGSLSDAESSGLSVVPRGFSGWKRPFLFPSSLRASRTTEAFTLCNRECKNGEEG